jgi:hypothetical protein
MTHSFTLMAIMTFDASGKELTCSEVTADGSKATHRGEDAEFLYNVLHPYFMNHLSKNVEKTLEAKIAERWQEYLREATPRWAEITVTKLGLNKHGKDMGIEKVVFGIGTFFHVGSASDHFALKEHALSQIKIPRFNGETTFTMITDPQGKVLRFGVKDAAPRQQSAAPLKP